MGIDTDAILAGAGVERSVVEDPDGYLSSAQVRELWRRAYQASGDPDLALHAAEALRFGAYRVVDFVAGCAATVGDAIRQVSAYFPIINSAVRLPITEEARGVSLGVECPEDPSALTRPYVEYTFAAVFLRVRGATGVNFSPERVELGFPAPPRTTEHERIFGCTVRFDCERSLLRLSRASWDAANTRADPDLFNVLTEHARAVGKKVPTEPDPVRQTRRAIMEQLGCGSLSLEAVAKELAMSPRTLQRRLREHGVTYADLLESTREAAAKSYLAEREISVAELAFLLGFAEQSSFNHAFKRWTGQTPNEFRRHARPHLRRAPSAARAAWSEQRH